MQILAGTIDAAPTKDGKYVANPLVTRPFVEKFGLQFPVGAIDPNVVGEYGQYSPLTRTFVPFIYFVDREGIIRGQFMGNDPFFKDEANNMRKTLDGLLAPKAPVKKPPVAAPKAPAAKKQPAAATAAPKK